MWYREFNGKVWHAGRTEFDGEERITRCGRWIEEFLYRKEFLHNERRCMKCESQQS